MSRVKEDLLHAEEDAESAAWTASPEGRAEKERATRAQAAADAERARREQAWASERPVEWAEWQRLQPLLVPVIDFGGDMRFDFDNFLMEVGRAPSPAHRVVRKAKALPYKQGNLRWKAATPPKTNPSPAPSRAAAQAASDFLTKQEVADRLQVSTRTVSRWRSEGLLKEFRRGQVLRFKLEDVEAFEAKGRSGRR
ncbi:helix-turn-helix domain-containing protein [Urbifossiella limnaea]|uniref:Helix-turn-helix domain protein n=1 Tax=Urbifossiella limnaea TaxID=2528023 RepID=A0A517XSY4_9BACT|nr:helix-turn-helix domain-containing protein [Urbifossiella limnaea]QDU20602.1 Helix-turn-helix domain protein [Urbifossiella limnaea]